MSKKVNVAHKFTKSANSIRAVSVAMLDGKKYAKVSVIDTRAASQFGYTIKQVKEFVTLSHERQILEAMERQAK